MVTPQVPQKYLSLLSRGGLITPSSSMATYVGKSFAIMDTVEDAIHKSPYPARAFAEKVLEMNEKKEDFVCKRPFEMGCKIRKQNGCECFL